MNNDQLPDRDPTKTNAQQGLYGKFLIERTDGSSAPGGKHHGCQYFVLDVTHDKHAAVALAAYAGAVAATHPQLAADMRARWSLPAQSAVDAPAPVVATWRERVKYLDRPTDFAERCAAVEEARDLRWALTDAYARIASMRTEWGAEVAALTAQARQAPKVEALEDAIRAGLSGTYHCTRVWGAWGVGTMSEDDFEPVDESDTPREIAQAVLALLSEGKAAGVAAQALRDAVQLPDMLAASEAAEPSGEEP